MKFKFLKTVVTGLLLTVCSFANAGLIEVDLLSAGDNLIIQSSDTQSEYIKLSATNNTRAINESLYSDLGFRWATLEEMLVLYISIGLSNSSGIWDSPTDYGKALAAVSLFTSGEVTDSMNLFVDDGSAGSKIGTWSQLRINPGSYETHIYEISIPDAPLYAEAGPHAEATGQLMIRTVAVPEPSSLAIFALGMMGLASRRFKKQS